MEKRSTPKDAVRLAVPSTTERSLREFSSPQRAFFLRFRPKLPVKAEKTPRFLKKTPRYLEHIPKVRTFASQLRTRALSSAGSERLPYKQRVGGSNPSAPTLIFPFQKTPIPNRALSSAGSERLPYKQRVGGSNPSAPTSQEATQKSRFFFCPSRFDSELRRGVRNTRERARMTCHFFGMPRLLSSQVLA